MDHERPDFGDPAAELQAALGAVALVDASAFARLVGTGPDLLDLLQRLSTGDVKRLGPGAGCATVLTTNKGRIVQRLWVSHLGPDGVLLTAGAGGAPRVLEHLQRYTFAEDTGLRDVTADTALLALTGPRVAAALEALGLEPLPPLGAKRVALGDADAWQLGTDGLSQAGCAFFVPRAARDAAWAVLTAALAAAGGRPAGHTAFEAARVLRGLGAHGHELTDAYNPLEAGERQAVSFTKGCYVGQEVVARLENYDKIARTLYGVTFDARAPVPASATPLLRDGREVGRVTSALVPPGLDRGVGLASVKHREAAPGDALIAGADGGPPLRLVALPFAEAAGARP